MKTSLLRNVALAAILFLILFPCKGEAIIIDFEQASPEGGIINTYAGGTGAVGYFPINMMKVSGAGSADGTYDVQGPLGAGAYAAMYFDTNNYIKLVGSVPTLGVGGAGNVDLLWGTFTSYNIITIPGGFSLMASGIDTKSSALLSALGIVGEQNWEFFGFTMTGSKIEGGYKAISSDIRNATVPEPLSMVLIGIGLIGLAVVKRKTN
jgi:hypothetical protein